MTNPHQHGPSRPGSSRGTRDSGQWRKNRVSKPYKASNATIPKKPRRKNVPPPGYTFLAIGTQDLAQKCIALSSQLNFDVINVTGAHNSFARDPKKVSHHIARIGYYFKAEVLEQACEALGYVPHHGKYVKEELIAKQNLEERRTRVAARYGLVVAQTENMEQVRSTIKELFPHIPDDDLEQVIKTGWAPGNVGTQTHLPLPRRAALATGAHVRHVHTDYDMLLRSFRYHTARAEVEAECLSKLQEWSAATGDDQKMLVELSRESIPEAGVNDHIGEHRNEPEDLETGDDDSDASVEFIHERVAAGNEIGAEVDDEAARSFLNRYQSSNRTMDVQIRSAFVHPEARDATEVKGRKFRRVAALDNESSHTPQSQYPWHHATERLPHQHYPLHQAADHTPQQQSPWHQAVGNASQQQSTWHQAAGHTPHQYQPIAMTTPLQPQQYQQRHDYQYKAPSPYQTPNTHEAYQYTTTPYTGHSIDAYRHDKAIPSIEHTHDYTQEANPVARGPYHPRPDLAAAIALEDPFTTHPQPTSAQQPVPQSTLPFPQAFPSAFSSAPQPAPQPAPPVGVPYASQSVPYAAPYYPVHGGMAPVQPMLRRGEEYGAR